MPVCQGLITRKRDLMSGKSEKSVIDFVVVCSRVLPYVTEMIIDEANQFITRNYTQAKTAKVKAINSDHNTQFVKVNLKVVPCKEVNREIFNLKNLECQMSFKRSTDKTNDFSSCFKGNETLLVKCEKWKKSLDFHIKKSFRKIKVKKNKPNHSAADSLIDKRNTMNNSGNINTFEIDALIAQTILKEEINKAQEFKKFCNLTGTICLQKMWKMKKKLWPKKKTSLPTAKRNHKGRLITSPKELMLTLHKEYQDRLRPRKSKQDLKEHMDRVHEATQLKLSKAWSNKSPEFSMNELEKGMHDLNKGRARDPSGLCSEIFKINVMGADMKLSLLTMLNNIKCQGVIPNFMKESIVTSIPKSGSKFELKNERGIFKLSVLRSILLRLIYNRKYELIDSNMSDSNIGARKGKSCRNHIWIINGINHEVNSSKKHAQLVMQSYDYSQMFDSMSLSITISDLFDCGLQDDLLVLLNEVNKDITMSVSTCYGLTEPIVLPSLVAQGDLFAPLQAAVQVDSMTRKLEDDDKARVEAGEPGLLYRYKGTVPIPSLGLMDDNLTVSNAGFKAEEVNIFMNENSAEKNLQFNQKNVNT